MEQGEKGGSLATSSVAIQDEKATAHHVALPVTAPQAPQAPNVPDGGLLAWIQCASSFVLMFNAWGMVNAFGVYQEFYQTRLLVNETASRISWIGSLQAFLLLFGTTVAGPLLDRGHLRALVVTGSFFVVFGMMMVSIATTYWQLVLAQGIVVGIGNGCLFMPSFGVLPTYFSKKRSLAMGIAASGSSVGAVIFTVMFHQLEPRVGFGWTNRIIAFLMLALSVVPILGFRQRVKPRTMRALVDKAALTEAPFLFFAVSIFLAFAGLYIPFFYVQVQALEQRITSSSLNFYLVALLNTGSFFGRLLPNYIADKIGPMNVVVPCTTIAGVLIFTWLSITSAGGLIAFCLLYGFFSGSYVALAPPITATLCPNLGVLGTRSGMLAIPMSIGLLIGNPIAGALARGGYVGLEVFSGALVMAAALAMLASRATKVGLLAVKRA